MPIDSVNKLAIDARLQHWTRILTHDFLGGPRIWKFSWVINFQKAGTAFFLTGLMFYYQNFSPAAYIYLALHGGYGVVWLLKDCVFPDPNWQSKITLAGGLNAFLFALGWYWVFGWLLISGVAKAHYPLADDAWFALCIFICLFGCVIMIAADAQKYFTLRLQRGLITDGMFKTIRHPNYLGEMMIYGSFAMLVWHWLPVLVLAFIWLGVFAVNMRMKEKSMARYPEWASYKKRTWWLVPYVF